VGRDLLRWYLTCEPGSKTRREVVKVEGIMVKEVIFVFTTCTCNYL